MYISSKRLLSNQMFSKQMFTLQQNVAITTAVLTTLQQKLCFIVGSSIKSIT